MDRVQCVIPTVEADTGLAAGRGLWTFAGGRRTALHGAHGHNLSTDVQIRSLSSFSTGPECEIRPRHGSR